MKTFIVTFAAVLLGFVVLSYQKEILGVFKDEPEVVAQPLPERAKLSEDRMVVYLKDVEVGDVVWTSPWSMAIDEERGCWIYLSSTYTKTKNEEDGEVLKVQRLEDGWKVDMTECKKGSWKHYVDAKSLSVNPHYSPVKELIQ